MGRSHAEVEEDRASNQDRGLKSAYLQIHVDRNYVCINWSSIKEDLLPDQIGVSAEFYTKNYDGGG